MLKDVATLEILQAPGLTFKIPELFNSIPRLTGASPMVATDPSDTFIPDTLGGSAQSSLHCHAEMLS